MLAAQTVHTSGVNIASLAAILAGVSAIVGVMIAIINRRTDKRDRRHDDEIANLRKDFTDGLTNLGNILNARLETKDAVSAIASRLSRLEGMINRPLKPGR